MRRFLLLVLCFLPLFPASAQETDTPSDTPYLYWYNDYLNAFIIERADGTDSRIFGEGLMDENTNQVGGAGWSPSGEWFAWTSRYSDFYGFDETAFDSWILNIDNQQRLSVTEQIQHAEFMRWSPVEDILFVAERLADEGNNENWRIYLIDVPNNKIIMHFEEVNCLDFMYAAQWSADGSHISYFTGERLDNNDYFVQSVSILRNGSIIEHPVDGFFCTFDFPDSIPCQTPDGRNITLNSEQTTLNLASPTSQQTIEIQSPEGKIYGLKLSDSGDYGVFFSCLTDPCTPSFWLLNLKTSEMMRVEESARFRPRQETMCTTLSYDAWTDWQVWRPTMNQVIYLDSEGNYFLLNAADGTQTLLTLPEIEVELLEWHWLNENELTASYEERKFGEQPLCKIFIFNVETQILKSTDIFPNYDWVNIAENGKYGVSISPTPTIHDLDRGTQIVVKPHQVKYVMAGGGGDIIWHTDSEWFISAELSAVAGGGKSPLHYGVIKTDGTLRRDFSVCLQEQCANWLPPQVNLDELPAPTTIETYKPDAVIPTPNFVTSLSWSPDSKLIASGAGDCFGCVIWDSIWDVETKQLMSSYEPSRTYGYQITWQQSDESYTPHITDRPSDEQYILAFSPDNQTYIGWHNNQYFVHDAESHIASFLLEQSDGLWFFNYSPDSKTIVGGGSSARIRFWDAETGRLLAILPIYGAGVAFSPDGKWLAGGVSWDIHLYDMAKIREWMNNQP